MSALKRIHSELAALIYDVEDEPPPARCEDIAHKLRVIATKYEIQARDGELLGERE